jgi:hypothetical protein
MFVSLLSALAIALPNITIERTAKGYIAKVATFDARQQNEVDAEIARRAAELCREKQIHWGEFRSLGKLGKIPGAGPAPVTGYVHEFSCVAPEQRVYEPAPPNWKPSAADEADVRRAFETYYARRDSGDFRAAWQMFEPGMLGSLASWSDQMRTANASLGRGTRRITAVSWELNPEAAEHPGVFVAIDFIGDYPTVHFYCGYLGLYRRGPGSYVIVREEQNQYQRGDGTEDSAQVAQMRAAMCRE